MSTKARQLFTSLELLSQFFNCLLLLLQECRVHVHGYHTSAPLTLFQPLTSTVLSTMTCLLPATHEFRYPAYRIMHRCAGEHAPENTLAAIKFGYNRYKNKAIEFDVQLSRDNVPVLIHDVELSRTTSGSGIVKNISHNTLSGLDAGSWYHESFTTERIPLFTEVVEYCKAKSIWMNIELKGSEEEMAMHDDKRMYHIGETVATLTASLFQEEMNQEDVDFKKLPLFSSFSIAALIAAKMAAPLIPRALLVWRKADVPNLIEVLRHLDCCAVHLCDVDIEEYDLAAIKEAGLKILVYTVNSSARAVELHALGIDAVCSDRFDVTINN
jgi:glycerophosphoryl diester phosphodiesterase